MNIRELLKKRSDSLSAAKGLTELADKENRDLSAEERGQFDTLMTEVETLGNQITTIQTERERLLRAEQSLPSSLSGENPAEKPVAAKQSNTLTRVDFEKLSAEDRMKFVRGSGRIVDKE